MGKARCNNNPLHPEYHSMDGCPQCAADIEVLLARTGAVDPPKKPKTFSKFSQETCKEIEELVALRDSALAEARGWDDKIIDLLKREMSL